MTSPEREGRESDEHRKVLQKADETLTEHRETVDRIRARLERALARYQERANGPR